VISSAAVVAWRSSHREVMAMCAIILTRGVRFATDDGPRPRLRGVKGYHHANLALVQVMGLGQSATVDRCVPVVAKTKEWAI
jgi:hypothetical protein